MITTHVINGEETPIKYGWGAIADICEKTKLELSQLEVLGNKPKYLFAMIWAGLKQGAKAKKKKFSLTVEDIPELLDAHPELIQVCSDAMSKSMVNPNEKAVGSPRKPKSSRPTS